MGILFLAIAAVTAWCILGAATQHVWGPWVNRISSSHRRERDRAKTEANTDMG